MTIDTEALHVYRYGPTGPPQILAIHGLTGHGRRWQTLATKYLPEFAIAAPDLLGHGRSSWAAPWTIEANVEALAGLLDGPTLVVGHSFGAALALHLATARPDLVSGMVLLDPAVGLDGQWMREIADAMLESPDYPDRDEARQEKFTGSWADVAPAELDADLDEHLIALPNGRYGWRLSVPAMMSYWSELARPIMLPPRGIATTLVCATWTDPPYVTEELVDGLTRRLGADFAVADFDCLHMVAQAKPSEVATLIRERLG